LSCSNRRRHDSLAGRSEGAAAEGCCVPVFSSMSSGAIADGLQDAAHPSRGEFRQLVRELVCDQQVGLDGLGDGPVGGMGLACILDLSGGPLGPLAAAHIRLPHVAV